MLAVVSAVREGDITKFTQGGKSLGPALTFYSKKHKGLIIKVLQTIYTTSLYTNYYLLYNSIISYN